MSSLKPTSNLSLALPWLLLICLAIVASQLWKDQLSIKENLISSQKELAQISALSLEYQILGGSISADLQTFTAASQAVEWLANSSKQHGLDTKIGIITDAQQRIQLEARFSQATFNRLIQWAQQQDTTNLALVSSQFTAADTGKVTGFVRLEMR